MRDEDPMYKNMLNYIVGDMKRFGLTPQQPCTASAIQILQTRALKELSRPIPDGYVSFLAAMDGIVWNGLIVYASKRSPISGSADCFIEGLLKRT
jgi:hypothetical protein